MTTTKSDVSRTYLGDQRPAVLALGLVVFPLRQKRRRGGPRRIEGGEDNDEDDGWNEAQHGVRDSTGAGALLLHRDPVVAEVHCDERDRTRGDDRDERGEARQHPPRLLLALPNRCLPLGRDKQRYEGERVKLSAACNSSTCNGKIYNVIT